MNEIKFRLAKPSDARQIANVHYSVRQSYDEGFFAQVNRSFLKQYYKVVLNDPYQIVVCAELDGQILGFSSGSMDVSKEFKAFRKNKWRFVWPLLTSAITNPKIIKAAFDRFMSIGGKSDKKFVNAEGARNEYWAWLPDRDDSYMSIYTQELMLYFMKCLGVKEVYGEMDTVNEKVVKFQINNGNEILERFSMPDGRERLRCVMKMEDHKFKLLYK
ncbi:MAG: hypothetical protein J5637_05245 [Prevotella sp.]|nr:hypothetical protein [Prevotella sp.]